MSNQESNYIASNLSDPKYCYDLVVATTAQSINATMKKYLYQYSNDPTVVWYGQENARDPISPMDPIPDIDPFAIPDGEEPPEELLNSPFVFAIKAGFGLPQGVDLRSIPDILILGHDRQKVTYQLFFHTFEIVQLNWGRRASYYWSHITQEAGNPYLFKFDVDMNFDETDPNSKFLHLPPDTQQRLKNLNTNSMFSVQQLYLDLNSAGLQNMPTIEGIPSDSEVYRILLDDFIQTYWNQLHKDGKFVLGYTATAKSAPAGAKSSLQPTSMNFNVSPHYDAAGNITDNNNLYTLNYLMNTEKRALQLGGAFPWNWVNSSEMGNIHGAMAIRREIFAEFLNQSLSRTLSPICIEPSTYVNIDTGCVTFSMSYLLNDGSAEFSYIQSPGSKILELTYSKEAKADDSCNMVVKTINAHFYLTATTEGKVMVSGTEISVTVSADLSIDLDDGDLFKVGAINGLVGGYSSTAVYIIAVDASGKLNVHMKDGYPKSSIQDSDVDSGLLSKIEGVADIEEKLEKQFSTMAGRLEAFTTTIENYLNRAGNQWVFPGGKTFVFEDARFSDSQDLIAHITYADPT